MDRDLQALGIDLDAEFESAYREIPIGTAHQQRWRESTRLFEACRAMGLDPQPLPKMGDPGQCVRCGRCVLGCRPGVKWDSGRFLRVALERGARVVSGCTVERRVVDADPCHRRGRAAACDGSSIRPTSS
jgi:ferredoxin